MTKHANATEFFENYPSIGNRAAPLGQSARLGVDEQELSNWAEQSIATSNKTGLGRLGTLAFWMVIVGLLAARFFVIDPAELRPAGTSSPSAVVSQSAPNH